MPRATLTPQHRVYTISSGTLAYLGGTADKREADAFDGVRVEHALGMMGSDIPSDGFRAMFQNRGWSVGQFVSDLPEGGQSVDTGLIFGDATTGVFATVQIPGDTAEADDTDTPTDQLDVPGDDVVFGDHLAFMLHMAATKPALYDAGENRVTDVLDLIHSCRDKADLIKQGFEAVQSEPVNMRILSGRLDGAGAALSTISQNYDKMAAEMVELLGGLSDATTGVFARLRNTAGAAIFLADVHATTRMIGDTDALPETERAVIATAGADMASLLNAAYGNLHDASRVVPDICRQVRRRINGLDVVKLLCRVESGRLPATDGGLNGIIDRLENFHNQTDENLAQMAALGSRINSMAAGLPDDTLRKRDGWGRPAPMAAAS